MANPNVVFSESQTVVSRVFTTGAWLLQTCFGILVFMTFMLGWQCFQLFVLHTKGSMPMDDRQALTLFGAYLLMLLLIFSMRLRTTVDDEGLAVSLPPLMRRKFKLDMKQVKSIEVCKYNAQKEYGGWGIRHGNNGQCFTMGGDTGVMIRLKGGSHILVGSRRSEELASTLTGLLPGKKKAK